MINKRSAEKLEHFRRQMVNAIVTNDSLLASIVSTQLIDAGYNLADFKEYVKTWEREFELAQERKNKELGHE